MVKSPIDQYQKDPLGISEEKTLVQKVVRLVPRIFFCISAYIHTRWEIQNLPYAGFLGNSSNTRWYTDCCYTIFRIDFKYQVVNRLMLHYLRKQFIYQVEHSLLPRYCWGNCFDTRWSTDWCYANWGNSLDIWWSTVSWPDVFEETLLIPDWAQMDATQFLRKQFGYREESISLPSCSWGGIF